MQSFCPLNFWIYSKFTSIPVSANCNFDGLKSSVTFPNCPKKFIQRPPVLPPPKTFVIPRLEYHPAVYAKLVGLDLNQLSPSSRTRQGVDSCMGEVRFYFLRVVCYTIMAATFRVSIYCSSIQERRTRSCAH